jgi:hypothetical protein
VFIPKYSYGHVDCSNSSIHVWFSACRALAVYCSCRILEQVKVHLEQAMKAERELDVQLYPLFNFGTRCVGGQRHAPATLPPGETQYPFYRRFIGAGFRSGRMRKTSPPPKLEARTVEPVASCYADCAIPAAMLELGDISHFVLRQFSRQILQATMEACDLSTNCHTQLAVIPPDPSGYSTHIQV